MGWFRTKQKEVAETFVEDATEKLKSSVKDTSQNWLWIALGLAPVVIPIVDHVIGIGKESVPAVSKGHNFTLYIDTVNLNIKGGQ